MRIVVSGTHASGKSTLIADFAAAHPEFDVLGDPFELVDAAGDEPDATTFFAQLRSSAARPGRPHSALVREAGRPQLGARAMP